MANNALAIVQKYFDLFAAKRYAESRALLSDDNFHFHGPFDTFHNADDLIAAVTRLGNIVEEVRTRKVFADGNDVCILYDFVAKPPAGTVLIAEWFHVEGDKIDSIEIVFDPRPFVAMFTQA